MSESNKTLVGDLCDFLSGHGFKKSDWSSEGLPIIRIQNLNGNRAFNYYAGEVDAKWVVEPGELLFAWAGTRGVSFGPTRWSGPRGLLNQHIYRVRPHNDVDPEWLNYALHYVTSRIERKAHGFKSSLVHVKKADITNQLVFAPDYVDQRAVAGTLGTWDRALETLQDLIDTKTERKRGLMQQLLTGQKRLPEFEDEPPERHLVDVAANASTSNKGRLSWDRLYGVTKAEGMVPMREHVRGVTTDRCKLVKSDWFAYNPMRLNIGSLARWHGADEVMVSGDYVVFRCREGQLDPRFFDHVRRTRHWEHFVNNSGSGSVRVRLYFKDIGRFKFRCPPIEEQRAIADLLDTCDRELDLHRQQLKAIREQKSGLMQKLLTGEVRATPEVPCPTK